MRGPVTNGVLVKRKEGPAVTEERTTEVGGSRGELYQILNDGLQGWVPMVNRASKLRPSGAEAQE